MDDSAHSERFGLGAALWRTRSYLLPQLKHFIVFAVLSGVAMLLELASTLVFFDLLTNKVFLGDPLSGTQASLLGLDPARFVDVETLDEEARFTLRTVFLVVAGALMAIGFLLGTGLGYYLTWILQRVNQHLRLAMMDRAVHLSLRYHDEAPVGDAIYRVYQDSAMVTTVVQNALIQPVTLLANLAIALVAIGFFEPYLGLLFLIAAIPSILAARAFTPRLRDGSAQSRLANSALTSHIQESVNGVRVLKAHQAEDTAFNTFRRRSHRALDRAYELRRRIAVLNLLVFLFTAAATCAAVASGLAKRMLSRTLAEKRMFSCVARAMCRRMDATVSERRSAPSTAMRPWSGSARRRSRDMSVDLPVPVGPTIAVTDPGDTSNDTSCSTGRDGS